MDSPHIIPEFDETKPPSRRLKPDSISPTAKSRRRQDTFETHGIQRCYSYNRAAGDGEFANCDLNNDVIARRCLFGCSEFGHPRDSSMPPFHSPCEHGVQGDPANFSDNSQCAEYTFSGRYPDLVDVLYNMKRYYNDESIQELGCEALWVQSWEDDDALTISAIGGIDRIVDAMVRFPDSYRLTFCACAALQNLASTRGTRERIVEVGGAPLIVTAMTRFLPSAGIQRSCCCTLASLAVSKDHAASLLEARADSALVSSLRMHFRDPVIRQYSLCALTMLRSDEPTFAHSSRMASLVEFQS